MAFVAREGAAEGEPNLDGWVPGDQRDCVTGTQAGAVQQPG
jgi:hypothetical protein